MRTKRELAERIGIAGKQPVILVDGVFRWYFDDKHEGALLTIDRDNRLHSGWGGYREIADKLGYDKARDVYSYLAYVKSPDAETFWDELHKWWSEILEKYPLKRG